MLKQTALVTLFSAAQATIFFTSPVASTSGSGGKELSIVWEDDGKSPSIADFGPSVFGIYAGGALQQTLLQSFGTIDDPSKVLSLSPVIPANIGPDSDQYFIRVTSVSGKDSAGTALNAFSAKFSLDGMSGKFSAQVEAQISSLSAAAAASKTVAASATSQAASASGAASTKAASAASASSASASASASASLSNATADSAASGLKVGMGAFFGLVASLAYLAL